MLVSVPSLPALKAVQMSQAKLCPIPASNFSCVGIPDQAVPHPCQLGYLGVSFEAAQHCLLSLPCCVRPSRCPPSPCPVVLLPAGTCHRMALHLLFFFLLLWLDLASDGSPVNLWVDCLSDSLILNPLRLCLVCGAWLSCILLLVKLKEKSCECRKKASVFLPSSVWVLWLNDETYCERRSCKAEGSLHIRTFWIFKNFGLNFSFEASAAGR